MESGAPVPRVLVGREDHGFSSDVPVVDNVVKDVGCIVTVGEIADLVDDEDVWLEVLRQRLSQAPFATGSRQVIDETGGCGEEGVEAILQSAIGDRDGKVGLATPRLALQDDGAPFRDEVGREEGADGGQTQGRLVAEIELFNRAQEGEGCGAYGASKAGSAAVRASSSNSL